MLWWTLTAGAVAPLPQCPAVADLCDLCLYTTLDALLDAVPVGLDCAFELRDGTYGPISIIGDRGVTLIGGSPGAVTLISGGAETSGLVRVETGASLTMIEMTLSGFQQRAFDIQGAELNLLDVVVTTLASIQEGGALRATNSLVTATDSVFLDNAATQRGGAVLGTSSELDFTGCQFIDGFASEGGAIWVGGGGVGSSSTLTVVNSTFLGNLAGASGGALFAGPGAEIVVQGSRFEGNFATLGGAVADGVQDPSRAAPIIEMFDCELEDNQAFELGGAIALRSSALGAFDVELVANEAGQGGAMHIVAPAIGDLARVTFCGNEAVDGGGLYLAGGEIDVDWHNLRFIDNIAEADGGALLHDSGALTLSNSNFLGNAAGGRGGAVRSTGPLVFHSNLLGWSTGVGIDSTDASIQSSVFFRNPTGDAAGIFAGDIDLRVADPVLRSYLPGGGCTGFPDLPGFHGPLRGAGLRLPDGASDNPVSTVVFHLDEPDEAVVSVAANDVGAFGGPEAFLQPWAADDDGDGVPEVYDCDDGDPLVAPLAVENYHDGLDQNCDRLADDDEDQDGFPLATDCDDTNAAVFPGAAEPLGSERDMNCDGRIDHDNDGFEPPIDCDDDDPTIHPGVAEDPDTRRDTNCDGIADVVRPLEPRNCSTAGPWGTWRGLTQALSRVRHR